MGKKKSRLGFSQVITISWFSKLKFLGRTRTPPATANQAKKSTPMVDISVPDCSRTFRGSSANDFCVSTISNLSFSPRILDRRIGRRQSGIEESGDGFRRLSLDQCFERENFGDFLEYLRHQPDEFDFARSSCGSCRSSISSVAKMVGNESDCEVSVAGKTKITETVPKPRKFSDMLSDIKKTHDHAGKFNISPKNEPETLTLGSKRFSERRKTRSFDDFVPRTAGFEIPRRRTTDRVTSKTDRENNENEQSISPQESRKKDLNSRNQEQKVTDLLSGNADRRKNHKFTYRDSAKENRRTSQEDHESRTLYPKERDRITSKQSHKSTASLSRKPDRRTARDKNETNNRLPTSEIQSKGTSKSVNKKKEQQRKIKQGNKIKVYSPSPASKIEFWREKTTQNQELQRRETKKKNGGVAESFAVTKRSFDPQKDFRESMVEMIAENRIGRPDELEDLLASYLCLNSDEYHDLIVKVFRQTDKLLARGNMEGGRSGTVLPQFPIQFHRRTFQTWHRRLDHSVSNRLRTLQSAFYTSFSSEIGTRSAFVKAVSLADIVNFWFLSSNKRVD